MKCFLQWCDPRPPPSKRPPFLHIHIDFSRLTNISLIIPLCFVRYSSCKYWQHWGKWWVGGSLKKPDQHSLFRKLNRMCINGGLDIGMGAFTHRLLSAVFHTMFWRRRRVCVGGVALMLSEYGIQADIVRALQHCRDGRICQGFTGLAVCLEEDYTSCTPLPLRFR